MSRTQKSTDSHQKTLSITHNGLNLECFFTETGKLHKKIERWNNTSIEFDYTFDKKGHLVKALRDGIVTEQYHYNQAGQRIEHHRTYAKTSRYATKEQLFYTIDGKLIKAGDASFSYDQHGALSERCDAQGVTKFSYGADTMLDKVVLPSGAVIQYEYGKENPICPVKRFKNNILTAEYTWENIFQLTEYTDYELHLKYTFTYTKENILDTICVARLSKNSPVSTDKTDWLENLVAEQRRERLQKLFPTPTTMLKLFCCADQIGTVKIVIDKQQTIKKELIYDSFGVQLYDSLPDLFMPIGFAGGLVDKDTGLVRFGWRDYDPTVGRFTALDPLGDTGGDHDLYDYCVDDPVSMNDPTGLIPPALLALAAPAARGAMWVAKHPATKQAGRYVMAAVQSPTGQKIVETAAQAATGQFMQVKLGALALGTASTYVGAGVIDVVRSVHKREWDFSTVKKVNEAMPHLLRGWGYTLAPQGAISAGVKGALSLPMVPVVGQKIMADYRPDLPTVPTVIKNFVFGSQSDSPKKDE